MHKLSEHLGFIVKNLVKTFVLNRSIDTSPHLDDELKNYFQKTLSINTRLLEFGAGGSTLWLSNLCEVATVETDKIFLRKIKKLNSAPRYYSLDLGITGKWGFPIFNPCFSSGYVAQAVEIIFKENPNVVLIDGRFRLSTFLLCCQLVYKQDSTLTVIFDDYVGREFYGLAEHFCEKSQTLGRAAIFVITKPSIKNVGMISKVLQVSQNDSR